MMYWRALSLAFSFLELSVVGEVVLNEIHYDPAVNTELREFIWLYNSGSDAVALDGWRLSGGVQFTFPPGASIPAEGYAVVAENPAALQRVFATSAFGPWTA